jgi:NAD(P)-dependent dehydrogenase (short-subunit alcohol dehydrogenase family)
MAGRLAGKVAIVTGAGSSGPGWGNGKATAVLFAREGARVFAVDVDWSAAQETRRIVEQEGGTCAVHAADVSDSDAVRAMAAACLERFGRIDVLHNNVGIVELGGAAETTEESWDRVQRVNLTSVFLTCKHALPQMERQGGGAIVNVGSVAGIRYLGIDYVAYAASKAALAQLTQQIALEYAARGIRANTIVPGLLDTPMVSARLAHAYPDADVPEMLARRGRQCPMGRMGDAWDVAYAALYLASDEARYVTGAQLIVDGGLTCAVPRAE